MSINDIRRIGFLDSISPGEETVVHLLTQQQIGQIHALYFTGKVEEARTMMHDFLTDYLRTQQAAQVPAQQLASSTATAPTEQAQADPAQPAAEAAKDEKTEVGEAKGWLPKITLPETIDLSNATSVAAKGLPWFMGGIAIILGLFLLNWLFGGLTGDFDFATFSGGPQIAGDIQIESRPLIDFTFYNLATVGLAFVSPLVGAVAVLMGLILINAIMDALSGVTGRDLVGIIGMPVILIALLAPSAITAGSVTLVALWAMTRQKDARRQLGAFSIIVLFVGMAVYLGQSNYLRLPTVGLLGLLRTILHWLFTVDQASRWIPVYVLVITFDVVATELIDLGKLTKWIGTGYDATSLGWLHVFLSVLALVTGQIPFAEQVSGQHQYWTIPAMGSVHFWFVNLNLALAVTIFGMEQVKSSGKPKPGEKPKKLMQRLTGSFAYAFAIAVMVYLTLAVFDGLTFVWAYLIATAFVGFILAVPVNIGKQVGNQTGTALFNQIFGDWTPVAGWIIVPNDTANFILTSVILVATAFPAIAPFIRLI